MCTCVPTGERSKQFTVDIMYNVAIEWHESFSLQLGPQPPENAQFGAITVATITILDNEVSGSVVLPAPPVVVSLLHLDQAAGQGARVKQEPPSPGYPLACLTPCDPRHPSYPTTRPLCVESDVNTASISYQWEVAMPPRHSHTHTGMAAREDDGDDKNDDSPTNRSRSRVKFVRVTDATLFTSVDDWVLDSIYFRPHFQVIFI